jgi:5'-phosphate synthase pdxT subunit
MARIGVLAYQGDVDRHLGMLQNLGVTTTRVRTPEDMDTVDGLIIPGGESTTIGKLLTRFGVGDRIRLAASMGMPIFGTCAGAILLSRRIVASEQYRLGLMDIAVERNAYGRQVESFEARFPIPSLGLTDAVGVFIRAPRITETGADVEVLARFEGAPVLVRQANLVAATFHPELSGENRIHEHFLSLVAQSVTSR